MVRLRRVRDEILASSTKTSTLSGLLVGRFFFKKITKEEIINSKDLAGDGKIKKAWQHCLGQLAPRLR